MFFAKSGNQLESTRNSLPSCARSIIEDVPEEGVKALTILIDKHVAARSTDLFKGSTPMQKLSSDWVAGVQGPVSSSCSFEGEDAFVKEAGLRVSQRAVSKKFFYGSSALRQDCVQIEAESDMATRKEQICEWPRKLL